MSDATPEDKKELSPIPTQQCEFTEDTKAAVDWAWEVSHLGQIRLAMCESQDEAIALCDHLFGVDPTARAANCDAPRRWNNVALIEKGVPVYRPWRGKTIEGMRNK